MTKRTTKTRRKTRRTVGSWNDRRGARYRLPSCFARVDLAPSTTKLVRLPGCRLLLFCFALRNLCLGDPGLARLWPGGRRRGRSYLGLGSDLRGGFARSNCELTCSGALFSGFPGRPGLSLRHGNCLPRGSFLGCRCCRTLRHWQPVDGLHGALLRGERFSRRRLRFGRPCLARWRLGNRRRHALRVGVGL